MVTENTCLTEHLKKFGGETGEMWFQIIYIGMKISEEHRVSN
jgi:hypothetical protein